MVPVKSILIDDDHTVKLICAFAKLEDRKPTNAARVLIKRACETIPELNCKYSKTISRK